MAKILIVDDSQFMRKVLTKTLTEADLYATISILLTKKELEKILKKKRNLKKKYEH